MKYIIISITLAIVFIGGTIMLLRSGVDDSSGATNNVTMVDGKQIIEINVKGGYNPRVTEARAGVPTILRFVTNGTFDCSSSIRIPSFGISKSLPISGTTDIDLGSAQVGELQGSCAMGMYPFEVNFVKS